MPGIAEERNRQGRPDLSNVRNAVRRVLTDVAATTGLEPTSSLCQDDDPGFVVVWIRVSGSGARGISVDASYGAEELATQIADDASEEVAEALVELHRVDEARTWPKCPHHEHSLNPEFHPNLGAVWQCPSRPAVRIAIGSLADFVPK